MTQSATDNLRTYTGRDFDALVARIRTELGDDAVIVDRRESFDGGVGGFFAKKVLELDVLPGPSRAATAEGGMHTALFASELARAEADMLADEDAAPAQPAPAPAHKPHVDDRVADVTVDDLFAAPAEPSLAALFQAGLERARREPLAEAEPESAGAFEPEPAPVDPVPAVPTPPLPAVAPQPPHELAAELTDRGLPAELASEVVAEALGALAPLAGERDPRALVRAALVRRIPVATLPAAPRVTALVGPGGAGKTSVAACLLVAHREAGQAVSAVALRAPDAGASLGRALAEHGIAVHAATSGASLTLPAADLVVVDTPGTSRRAVHETATLAGDLQAAGVTEVHLAIPATTGERAGRELLESLAGLGITALVPTHVDETDALGTVVGLAIDCGTPLSYLAADDDLRSADAAAIASALLPA